VAFLRYVSTSCCAMTQSSRRRLSHAKPTLLFQRRRFRFRERALRGYGQ
jgi:hypothetical protein